LLKNDYEILEEGFRGVKDSLLIYPNSKIQNIRDLYRGIKDFKKGTSLDVI